MKPQTAAGVIDLQESQDRPGCGKELNCRDEARYVLPHDKRPNKNSESR